MMNEQVIHRYKLSPTMMVSTIIVIASPFICTIVLLFIGLPQEMAWIIWLPLAIGLVTISIIIPFIPINITVNRNELRINMLIKKKFINLNDISSVELIDKTPLKNSFLAVGIGGAFGNIGYAQNQILGKHEIYTTSNDDLILITLKNNRKIVTNCKQSAVSQYINIGSNPGPK